VPRDAVPVDRYDSPGFAVSFPDSAEYDLLVLMEALASTPHRFGRRVLIAAYLDKVPPG
jgi:hypothetical protein